LCPKNGHPKDPGGKGSEYFGSGDVPGYRIC
jgi:hypothetical protein